MTRNHQQHEAAYSFLDSTYDKLELALQTERTQTSTKKLPVLLHQRSRSDHVAEYNRKKDRRSTQLQRFLPVSGHINIVFQEMKSKNFQMDLSTILFNQLYANHVKYGKTLKMLDRRPGIQAINSVPVSPQKVRKTEGEMKDSNINSVQPEFVIKQALPSLYKRNRSITNSANSSVETKGKENAVQVLFVPSNLPTIKQPNQKYWSAGNLKITNRRPCNLSSSLRLQRRRTTLEFSAGQSA